MGVSKIAISLDAETVEELDRLVQERLFPNRSKAIQAAVSEKLARLRSGRLARECAKLDAEQEQILAEEGMGEDGQEWPAY